MSKFIYQSPGRYVQGKGIVSSIAEETERLGSHALIIADEVVWNITEEKIKESFSANNNVDFEYEVFKGESSEEEIQRIVKQYKEKNIDVVIGLGGGKALDTLFVIFLTSGDTSPISRSALLVIPTFAFP